jgi:hypothetical protein
MSPPASSPVSKSAPAAPAQPKRGRKVGKTVVTRIADNITREQRKTVHTLFQRACQRNGMGLKFSKRYLNDALDRVRGTAPGTLLIAEVAGTPRGFAIVSEVYDSNTYFFGVDLVCAEPMHTPALDATDATTAGLVGGIGTELIRFILDYAMSFASSARVSVSFDAVSLQLAHYYYRLATDRNFRFASSKTWKEYLERHPPGPIRTNAQPTTPQRANSRTTSGQVSYDSFPVEFTHPHIRSRVNVGALRTRYGKQ